jgi:hypothetical protein
MMVKFDEMIAVHHIREVVHERVYKRRLGGIEMRGSRHLAGPPLYLYDGSLFTEWDWIDSARFWGVLEGGDEFFETLA